MQKLELFCKIHQKTDTENIIQDAASFIDENVNIQNLKDIAEKALYFDNLLNENCRENLISFQNTMNELRNELPHSFPFGKTGSAQRIMCTNIWIPGILNIWKMLLNGMGWLLKTANILWEKVPGSLYMKQ